MPETEETEARMTSYIVKADALVMSTGKINRRNNKPEVVRLRKGTRVNAPADHPAIQGFLATKALVPADSKFASPDFKLTAMRLTRAMGASDDPALEPVKDVLPMAQGATATSASILSKAAADIATERG